jgi:hypothetical protein
LEFASFGFGEFFLAERAPYFFGRIDKQRALKEVDKYLSKRDEILGWPSPSKFGQGSFDQSGARVLPSFPHPGGECVSLFGDSFTYGADVDHSDTWGNRLAELIGHRVANYGVGGYGTDQALLRFQRYKDDDSRFVILGIWPENITRNLTQYRALIGDYSSPFSFKPRFILSEDLQLKLVPIPDFSVRDMAILAESPEKYLKDEYFLPGTTGGPVHWSFPYTLGMIKILMHERLRPILSGKPSWSIYYDPEHPSNGLMLTYKIIERFQEISRSLQKVPLVVVFPSPLSVSYYEKAGHWVYEPLLQLMRDSDIDYYHLGPDLLEELDGREFLTLLADGGHFNEVANGLIADFLFQRLGGELFAELCGSDDAFVDGG